MACENSVKNNRYSSNGSIAYQVQFDGGWSKRSYKYNFNALSCALPIIEAYTGKIINLQVANKYCSVC